MPSYKSKTGYACSCPDGNCDMSCRMYRLVSNKQSNADKIRAMSDDEMADYLRWHNDLYSRNGMDWLDWLKQESE